MWSPTPRMQAALKAKVTRPAILFALDHLLGWLRLWSGTGKITWNGDAYYGAGALLSASPATGTTELQVVTMTFRLMAPDFGDDDVAIMNILLSPVRRCPLYSWKALLDENAQVIPEPRLRFKGYADSPRLTEDVQSGSRVVELSVQGSLYNLVAPTKKQISHETQIKKYPNDTGLGLMASLTNNQLVWDIGAYNNFTPPP